MTCACTTPRVRGTDKLIGIRQQIRYRGRYDRDVEALIKSACPVFSSNIFQFRRSDFPKKALVRGLGVPRIFQEFHFINRDRNNRETFMAAHPYLDDYIYYTLKILIHFVGFRPASMLNCAETGKRFDFNVTKGTNLSFLIYAIIK
jgi:hypothetical protein